MKPCAVCTTSSCYDMVFRCSGKAINYLPSPNLFVVVCILVGPQVIHSVSSPNVLKFYDWYETRNNVWLILEFCTGGDLLTLIKQVNGWSQSPPHSNVDVCIPFTDATMAKLHRGRFSTALYANLNRIETRCTVDTNLVARQLCHMLLS